MKTVNNILLIFAPLKVSDFQWCSFIAILYKDKTACICNMHKGLSPVKLKYYKL